MADTPRDILNKRVQATLKKAAMGRTQATANALLAKLSDAEIASLPARTHLDILSNLHVPDTQRLPDRQIMASQCKLYRNMALDPDFVAAEDARIGRIASAIIADPAIVKARKAWPKMTDTEKVAIMQKVVDIHSAQSKLKPAKIVTFHEEPDEEPNPDGGEPLLFIRHASFDFASECIEVNTHEYSALHRFDEALVTLLHENNHNHQLQLIERLRNGQVNEGDKEYTQIALFSLNYTRTGMVPSTGDDYQAYLKQPVEDHAEWAAQQVTDKVMKALRTPPPPAPTADAGKDRPKADRRTPMMPPSGL